MSYSEIEILVLDCLPSSNLRFALQGGSSQILKGATFRAYAKYVRERRYALKAGEKFLGSWLWSSKSICQLEPAVVLNLSTQKYFEPFEPRFTA